MPKQVINTTNKEYEDVPEKVQATKTIAEKIKYDYDNGAWSPLQLALKYNVEVDEVLVAIGQGELLEVTIVGDQVDSAGPGVPINPGTRVKVPYTKN